jgi:hypothetical protein
VNGASYVVGGEIMKVIVTDVPVVNMVTKVAWGFPIQPRLYTGFDVIALF